MTKDAGCLVGSNALVLLRAPIALVRLEQDCHSGRRLRTRAYPKVCPQRRPNEVYQRWEDQLSDTQRAGRRRSSPASNTARSSRKAISPCTQRSASSSHRGAGWHTLRIPQATIPSRENPTLHRTSGFHQDRGLGGLGLRYRVPRLPPYAKVCRFTTKVAFTICLHPQHRRSLPKAGQQPVWHARCVLTIARQFAPQKTLLESNPHHQQHKRNHSEQNCDVRSQP